MKRTLFICAILLLIMTGLFIYPSESKTLASIGLLNWYRDMIPSLFPFMILSQMLIHLNLTSCVTCLFHPVLKVLFHVSPACEYAIAIGFLCGFPMGAVTAFSLLKTNKLSPEEASFLLSFCNIIGPVYTLTCILPFYAEKLRLFILSGLFLIPLCYGIFLRYTLYRNKIPIYCASDLGTPSFSVSFTDAFESSVNCAVKSIVKLGAIMVLFNTIKLLPLKLFSSNELLSIAISSLFEINSGVRLFTQIAQPRISLIFLVFLPLGGLSCLYQTVSCAESCRFHLFSYLLHRMILFFLSLLFFGLISFFIQ